MDETPIKNIIILGKTGDYITCPYPTTAFYKCRTLICLDKLDTFPSRCPGCGRGL